MIRKHYHCINHGKPDSSYVPLPTPQSTKVDWELWFPRVPRTHLSQEGRYLELFLLQVSGELLLQVSFGLLLQDTLFPQPTHLRTPTHGQLTHPRSAHTPMTLKVNPITYGYPHIHSYPKLAHTVSLPTYIVHHPPTHPIPTLIHYFL